MTNLNQQILKFDYEQNFKDQDFYVSNSNEHSFSLLNSWPKWDKNFINLIGEKFSGKSHLINIFLEKHRGIKINAEDINNDFLQQIKIYENIIVEDLTEKINENLLFTLINIIDQDNKYLIVTSKIPIVNFKFKLDDLSCYGMFTSIDPSKAISVFKGSHTLQGNLDPKILLEEDSVIKESVIKMLSEFNDFPGYIFNLGHGITPDINPDKVKVLVETIRESGS